MEKQILQTKDEMIERAAKEVLAMARASVAARGVFHWVLSGGKTPKALYQLLMSKTYVDQFPWKETHFYWGDERCVHPDNENSNYGIAYHAMLGKNELAIPFDHIHEMYDGQTDPQQAAAEYEKQLRKLFPPTENQKWPVMDLVLLGMGPDGHTLSLFPGDEEHLNEYQKWVINVFAPTGNPPGQRITLTLPVVNAARTIIFLVGGKAKRNTLRRIWANCDEAQKHFPAARVQAQERLLWLTDKEAGDVYSTEC